MKENKDLPSLTSHMLITVITLHLMQNYLKSSKDIRTFKWFPINLVLFLLSFLSFLLLNLATWFEKYFQSPRTVQFTTKMFTVFPKCVI